MITFNIPSQQHVLQGILVLKQGEHTGGNQTYSLVTLIRTILLLLLLLFIVIIIINYYYFVDTNNSNTIVVFWVIFPNA